MSLKWRTVLVLALGECLTMGLWFSASAVTPSLAKVWHLSSGGVAWLTMSVQIGFVAGAFLSAFFNIADIFPARWVIAIGAFVGAVANAAIAVWIHSLPPALVLRLITGACMALVYPVGMKIMATWMKEDRGLGLGLLVGALTVGSASPHLLRVFGEINDWQAVLYLASGLSLTGGLLVLVFGHPGPYQTPTPKFNWHYVGETFRNRGVRLANFGYFGHMWELYAMWTWIPIFILNAFRQGTDGTPHIAMQKFAGVVAFSAIAIGGLGSLLAGYIADRWGRTRTTIASMAISGTCAAVIGLFYPVNPWLVSIIALVWGFAVVADSAQFSTCVSELCTKEYMGTALTLQTSLGFLLTLFSIRLIPVLVP
ncbi:MAG: MFS transporter, partial [Calditrichaeota bacterium]